MADANSLPEPAGWALSRPTLVALGLSFLAVLSAVLTYLAVTGVLPTPVTPTLIVALLAINGVLVLALAGLILWSVIRLWRDRRAGQAGARLHMRMVAMFAAVAVVPAIFVAIFAAVTLNFGIEAWFSARVKSALENAVNVAERYVQGHERLIVADAYEIANSIEHDPNLFDDQNHARAEVLFTRLAELTKERGLQASYILDSKRHILGSTKQRFLPDLKLPSDADLQAAAKGTIVIDANSNVGVVRALIRMQALNDAYLLVVRSVDPKVLGYYQRTVDAASEYERLDKSRSDIQLIFAVLYAVVTLLIVLAAIWLGFWAANRLVMPISRLIGAAERVSEGDLKAQVQVNRDDDEIGSLGLAFNRMTQQLDAQRNELVEASHQIDTRRRFTEAVLAGVSAGVIGLDASGRITIVNRAAARLLHADPGEIEGRTYAEAVPELGALIKRAMDEPVGHSSGEASVKRGGTARSLSVQVASETGASGYVITFDDITDLVSAQRTAAWADVARRIAHEIKNPLTPIQLSAERLKRKYGKEVSTDPEVFDQCTDTIIRQVGDIGRMVDEFSSFARMPAPVMRRENMQELLQQAIFLQRVANPQIVFDTKLPKKTIYLECDGRLVSQAFTNVLKNAVEAIGGRMAEGDDAPGHIICKMELRDDKLVVSVADNGIGLPREERHRLTEPYVTTRAKGTGLGLAIVRKILEDHGGEIALSDREDEHGAEIRLTFPIRNMSEETEEQNEQARIANLA